MPADPPDRDPHAKEGSDLLAEFDRPGRTPIPGATTPRRYAGRYLQREASDPNLGARLELVVDERQAATMPARDGTSRRPRAVWLLAGAVFVGILAIGGGLAWIVTGDSAPPPRAPQAVSIPVPSITPRAAAEPIPTPAPITAESVTTATAPRPRRPKPVPAASRRADYDYDL